MLLAWNVKGNPQIASGNARTGVNMKASVRPPDVLWMAPEALLAFAGKINMHAVHSNESRCCRIFLT